MAKKKTASKTRKRKPEPKRKGKAKTKLQSVERGLRRKRAEAAAVEKDGKDETPADLGPIVLPERQQYTRHIRGGGVS